MKTPVKLSQPIEQYLRAVNSGDSKAFLSSFAIDARVKDVQREIRGLDAIKKWARHDIFDVHARLDPVKVQERRGRTIVTVKIDGLFDRTGLPDPLLMKHDFKVADGKITELKVSFAP
jgi:hypothetical protein